MKKVLSIASLLLMTITAHSQDFSDVEVKAHQVAGDVYMLTGAGGNIGLLATDKGLLLVDDQFEPLAEKIEAAMNTVNNQPLKYVINTHYHGDHTGSNGYFSHKAPIFAHENVRTRLQSKTDHQSASLPVVTYQNGVNIYLENEDIQLTHYPHGHTDGDTVVYFKKANVLHTGDLFFQGRFPYVDLDGGGSVKGYLANVRAIVASMPDDVKIIPGHGDITTKQGYSDFADMIEYSIRLVENALAEGKTEQQIIETGVAEKYKGLSWRFITEERWLKTLVRDLSN
jgi:glyoxylase-like metal-dependent hydrolase (beta-lactamase superfamily II)